MLRAFRYKLAPTAEQAVLLREHSGVCRLVYNTALTQRRDCWRQFKSRTGRRLNYVAQARELTLLRAEFDWISAVTQACQQQALRDLEQAFQNYFAGRSKYPTPRKKGVDEGFRFPGRMVAVEKLNHKWAAVRLPKIGLVKFRLTRPLRGTVKNATIRADVLGWFVSFTSEVESESAEVAGGAVGIDRGVNNTLVLSTGEQLSLPQSLKLIELRHRRAQRVLSRRRRGSKRRYRQLQKCRALSAKRMRVRHDWHHKISTLIAQRFGLVVLENLKIAGMSASAAGTIGRPGINVRQKAGLNRSILNQGWFVFETMLAYKLEERGGYLSKVNPAFTSQTCSECGAIDSQSRKSQARFHCLHCGFAIHADHNAAINILRRNTALMRMEEGQVQPPSEVRTGWGHPASENPAVYSVGGC